MFEKDITGFQSDLGFTIMKVEKWKFLHWNEKLPHGYDRLRCFNT